MVRAPVPGTQWRLPEALLLRRAQVGVLSALRRWAERAVATGILTVADIRNGAAAACTLLPGGISSVAISPPEKPTLVASAGRPDEAAELLDDFLIALLKLPGEGWSDIMVGRLPDELFDRIDQYLEARLS